MEQAPLALIVLALAFGFASRFAGGGFGWEKLAHDHGGPLHGRGIYYAGPLVVAVSAFVGWKLLPDHAAALALTALGWAVVRGIAFTKDGTTPDTAGEILLALGRHALVGAWGCGVAVWRDVPYMGLAMLAWAVAATALAVLYGVKKHQAEKAGKDVGSFNSFIETAQGLLVSPALVFGVAAPLLQ